MGRLCLFLAGGSSSIDSAVLVLSIGDAFRDNFTDILWNSGELDGVFDQCFVY